jgi:hypothetical protein
MKINMQIEKKEIDGYVYVARIIDHGGNFLNGYHKIGLSKQYKIRETQLNSTHLPFDVLMIRVFETNNMKQLEGLLHICFEDYRVVKEYDDRKNITTEWFNVSDIDTFNYRIDKLVGLISETKEIDISRSIDNDTTLTQEEKEQTKESIIRAKASNLKIEVDGNDISGENARVGFINFVKQVIDKNDESIIENDFQEFVKYDISLFPSWVKGSEKIGNIYLRTHCDTQHKKSMIEKMILKYSINAKVEVIQ